MAYIQKPGFRGYISQEDVERMSKEHKKLTDKKVESIKKKMGLTPPPPKPQPTSNIDHYIATGYTFVGDYPTSSFTSKPNEELKTPELPKKNKVQFNIEKIS